MLGAQPITYPDKCGPEKWLLKVAFLQRSHSVNRWRPKCDGVFRLPLILFIPREWSEEDVQWGLLWFSPDSQTVFDPTVFCPYSACLSIMLLVFYMLLKDVNEERSCYATPRKGELGWNSHGNILNTKEHPRGWCKVLWLESVMSKFATLVKFTIVILCYKDLEQW